MWEYHDKKMKELKKIYQRISKQTQNRLQEIFNSIDFDFSKLYNIADKKTKKQIDTYIEEWKDKDLLKGYFGSLANNIYNRTRVKNSEILELLIYGAYVEEQSKIAEHELTIFKEVSNYYYQEGQTEVIKTMPEKKKKHFHSTFIPEVLFMTLLTIPNSKGYIWKEYNDAMAKYNADQIFRQTIIDLQQGKDLYIESDIYQNIIRRQQNTKLNINDDKISGDADLTLIGINNQAKIEGIKKIDSNAKVIFMANLDGKETPMCHSLNNQEFYINKENEFNRYYGDTPKDLSIQRIKCKGLVLGLNLPPISHHFHWCRSMIGYISTVEKEEKIEYNNAEYVRKNKITDNRTLDEKIKKVKKKFPKYIQEYIDNTPIEIIGYGKNNHYFNKKMYLLNDATEEEIIHEIGHIIEEKLDIANDNKYQTILKNNIGEIDVFNNSIGSIEGYDADKYEFLLTGDKFVSNYQRRVYNIDINKNNRIDYMNGTFNYNVFRDYFPEGLRCYFIDKQLLKTKNNDLFEYIEEVLHERK